jgi:ribosomal protein S18 acetylase RimI-like enzyme
MKGTNLKKISDISIRAATTGDDDFLFELFRSTRIDISLAPHLTEQMKSQLMKTQFIAQQRHYAEKFPRATRGIIQVDNKPAGRLCVNRTEQEIHIIDISLSPEFREQGIGSRIMSQLILESNQSRQPIRVHVEKPSRAVDFYRRWGFVQIGEIPTHFEMKRIPESPGILLTE